jgi:uncharacterized protein with von Willebrand factor type A (vWA) domain
MAEELAHATAAYNAAQRREYYLRTRKLKGRKHGSVKPAHPHKTRAQRQAERRKHQEAKIAELKARLQKLQEVLAAEVKKAQARSGVKTHKTEPKTTSSPKSNSNSKPEHLTAAQKAKKAKEDKKRREKNKDLSLDEQVKSLTQRIKTIQERIVKMRKDGSVGARRNTAK